VLIAGDAQSARLFANEVLKLAHGGAEKLNLISVRER
jgi:hypothetical protein